ncbi:MAG TPA: OmpA family protein [Puia sp.]|nr:OmpA family protein [Puia sp.]
MKKIGLFIALFALSQSLRAQITDPKQVAQQGATDHVNSNVSGGVDNGLNKTENAIKGLFKKKPKAAPAAGTSGTTAQGSPGTTSQGSATGTTSQTSVTGTGGQGNSTQGPGAQNSSMAGSGQAGTVPLKTYSNYDFVPGEHVLFEDNFLDDQDGEFPAHWALESGQAIINKANGEPAFFLTEGNYVRVSPRMKTENNYLPQNFTIEFDFYPTEGAYSPGLLFTSPDNGSRYLFFGKEVSSGYFLKDFSAEFPGDKENFAGRWHHAAMIKKGNQIKCYLDQYRVLVIPDCGECTVSKLDVGGIGSTQDPIVFRNFRLAEGGSMNMIGKKFTEAKIVTHGINFDIGKATIKPESMGTLNMIVQVLKDNPDIGFEVDGHTDNTGNAPHNLQLSQQRADAVRAQLVSMGVDAARLSTKGYGDTKPVADNGTPEGNANNRRVEFVKTGH